MITRERIAELRAKAAENGRLNYARAIEVLDAAESALELRAKLDKAVGVLLLRAAHDPGCHAVCICGLDATIASFK